jgi:DNA polymerase III alpha subunit
METILNSQMKNIERLQKLVDQNGIKRIKIKSISQFKYKGKVFDLTVEDTHCYQLNDIFSSNSSGGSLVCYLLGITQVNPFNYGLSFDRFLSESRGGNMLKVTMD